MKKVKTIAVTLALAMSMGFINSSFAEELETYSSEIDSTIDDIIDKYEAIERSKRERLNMLDELNLSFSMGNNYYNKTLEAKSVEEIEEIFSEAKSESEKNEKIFPGRTYRIIRRKKGVIQRLTSMKISDDGFVTGNYEEERNDISKEYYDLIIEEINNTNNHDEISKLMTLVDLVVTDRSYDREEESSNDIEIDEKLKFFELKDKYSREIRDLNLSLSQVEDFSKKIMGADSTEKVESIFKEAVSESDKNEENFPGRTYYIIKLKSEFKYELRSLEISDDGIVTGNYDKETGKEISKEDYEFIIKKLNETNDSQSIYSLERYLRYVSTEKNSYEKDADVEEEAEIEKADKTLLKKLLDKKYKKEDYTEDSYKFYIMIHTASKKVYDDKEAYQSDVDKALTNLNTAINLLEKVEKTEENKDVKENSEDKNKPATDKEKPEKNINKKIEEAIHRIEVKLGGLKYIKEAMPETYKRYKDIMDDAIVDTEKALKQAKEFLKN